MAEENPEKNYKPVDHLNKRYNKILDAKEEGQSIIQYCDSLSENDATLMRIMTWYYKIFDSGYHALYVIGFLNPEYVAVVMKDIFDFGSAVEWEEMMKSAEEIPTVIEHIAKKPEKEETVEHDKWLDKMNDLNDACTDRFIDSDELFYERMYNFHNKNGQ